MPYFNEYLGEWVGGNPTPTTVEEMYRGILPAPSQPAAPASGLQTRQVNTVPINPATGMPYASQTKSPLSAPGMGATLAELFAIRDPGYDSTRETIVAGSKRDGVGFEAGNAYGPSYRLLPETPDTPALRAASTLAGSFGSGRGVGGSISVPGGITASTGGILADAGNDPWEGLRRPSEQPRRLSLDASAPDGVSATYSPMGGSSLAEMFAPSGQRANGTNGYIYEADGQGGWKNVGSANPTTAPGAAPFVNYNPAPSSPLSSFDSGAMLPASMNNDRWHTGY